MKEVNVLILQLSTGQSIWLGKDIQVIILGHFNGITHIGIEAPPDLKILTDEPLYKSQTNRND